MKAVFGGPEPCGVLLELACGLPGDCIVQSYVLVDGLRDAWLCRPVPLLLVLLFVFWVFGFSSGPNGVLTKGTLCSWTRPGLGELPNREMYVFNQNKKSSYVFFSRVY